MDKPLVSIVTPTFPGREKVLIDRCLMSVAQQDWPKVEHVIVSDRNPYLRQLLPNDGYVRFVEINESWRNPTTEASVGAIPWYVGSLLALGEFVGFIGDDDELLPHHVSTHVAAIQEAEAMFSVSQVDFRANGNHWNVIGDDSFELGHMDASGIMCHADALKVANWSANGENAADYRLVRDWRVAGLRGVFIPQVTAIHHDGWLVGKTGRPDR